jgi:hypothetical protein
MKKAILVRLTAAFAMMCAASCAMTLSAARAFPGQTPGIEICSACIAPGPPIPPSLLVAHPRDLPGFARARSRLLWATSAEVFVHRFSEDTPAEAAAEIPMLMHAGFREGVEESFHATGREGVSEALVFRSAQGAKDQLVTSLADALKEYEKTSLRRFVDPGIPGSAGLGNFTPGKPGATGNVFFSTGRCFFVVGDFVHDARTSAQGAKAPIAGATVLYRRTKHVCAAGSEPDERG